MGLSAYEKETIILSNEAEKTAEIYTHNAALQRQLSALCISNPGQVWQTDDNGCGGTTYELPKKWVKISPPRVLSEAQREVLDRINEKRRDNGV